MSCGMVVRTHLVCQGTAMDTEGEGQGQKGESSLAFDIPER